MGAYDDNWGRFESPITRYSPEAVEEIRDDQLAELDAMADASDQAAKLSAKAIQASNEGVTL